MITMCELLALNFNRPVTPDISLRAFRLRGMDNPDGWGLAYYADESVQVFKEPICCARSELSRFLCNYDSVRSQVIIGHVRKQMPGEGTVGRRNTHPYTRELYGRDYIFAHNGTLTGDYQAMDTGRFLPVGTSDTEHVFLCAAGPLRPAQPQGVVE